MRRRSARIRTSGYRHSPFCHGTCQRVDTPTPRRRAGRPAAAPTIAQPLESRHHQHLPQRPATGSSYGGRVPHPDSPVLHIVNCDRPALSDCGMDERDSSIRTSKGEPVVPTPDLHAARRPRPIRNAPSNAGGPLPMLLLAVLIASLVGVASWAVKERDRRLALTAENARLASENEQLRQALSAQQREAAKMRARLIQPPVTPSRPAPRSQPPPAPRWTP